MATVKYIGVGSRENTKRIGEDFNIRNVVESSFAGADVTSRSIANEMRMSEAIQKATGRPPRGIYFPDDWFKVRELSTGFGGGNYWVPENVDGANFFNALVPYSTVLKAGARMAVYRNGGNQKIVGFDTPAVVQWTEENGSPNPVNDPSFKAITMTPHILSCVIKVSGQLMMQSALEFNEIVKKELARAIALELDRVAMCGLGASNEPQGILHNNSIEADTFSDMSYSNLVDMVSAIDDAGANINGLSLITTPLVKKYMLKNFRRAPSGDVPVWNSIEDMDFFATNNLPNKVGEGQNTHSAIVGDFTNLVIGIWNGVDILVNKFRYSDSGAALITALVLADIGILHPESFRKNTSIVLE